MQTEPVKSERARLNKLDLRISGMSCASCVAKIEKGLSKVPGVVEAHVNFAAERPRSSMILPRRISQTWWAP